MRNLSSNGQHWNRLTSFTAPKKISSVSVSKTCMKKAEVKPLQVPCRGLNSVPVFFPLLQYISINFNNIFNAGQTFNILAKGHLKVVSVMLGKNSLHTLSTLYASAYAIPAFKQHLSANTKFECVFPRLQLKVEQNGNRKRKGCQISTHVFEN